MLNFRMWIMFDGFDDALNRALSDPSSLYGSSKRSIATATARRACAENQTKAIEEATRGRAGFAAMHDTASRRFGEDAALMAQGQQPFHHTFDFYVSTAEAYRKSDGTAEIIPFAPESRRARNTKADVHAA
jgi:hypothetical protein